MEMAFFDGNKLLQRLAKHGCLVLATAPASLVKVPKKVFSLLFIISIYYNNLEDYTADASLLPTYFSSAGSMKNNQDQS